jgi:hypothetical protein
MEKQMSVDTIHIPQTVLPPSPRREIPLIDAKDIKAILYLGIRGKVSLPVEKRKVDILA